MKTKVAAFVILLATGLYQASAQTIAVSISGTGITANPYNADSTPGGTGLVGMEFTVNQDIDLTSLGFYAQGLDGGDTPHVALLNITAGQSNPPTVLYDTGNLNNITNYPAGLTPDTINYFSVGTPILLTPGQTYEISAPIYFGLQFNSTANFTVGSALASVTYVQGGGWNGWDPTNGNPTEVYDYTAQTSSSPGAYISADFEYTTVPEPSTFAILGLGGFGLLFFLRRKKAALIS